MAWGYWRVPEAVLNILGDVSDRDVLELGCGAARWSIALAQRGARPVALDISPRQLGHARRLMDAAGVDFPLVEACGEQVPLPDASFDIVFCDWGAITYGDPLQSVPEAARLLRPNGLLAFSTWTPIASLCLDLPKGQIGPALVNDYFGMHRKDWMGIEVQFQLPYGEWIRLFGRAGLIIEDLIEIRRPAGATSTYLAPDAPEMEWALHWPMEHVWRLRRKP
ncbi:class I SAM-dependent methyltransferase [Inquilinus sp. CA228]|uniref:class I SAM-dependent methyltransferase n=1 Tax=Inquilinus sp. CA228 TaxID=3455609 RepID=UPI003F8D7814